MRPHIPPHQPLLRLMHPKPLQPLTPHLSSSFTLSLPIRKLLPLLVHHTPTLPNNTHLNRNVHQGYFRCQGYRPCELLAVLVDFVDVVDSEGDLVEVGLFD